MRCRPRRAPRQPPAHSSSSRQSPEASLRPAPQRQRSAPIRSQGNKHRTYPSRPPHMPPLPTLRTPENMLSFLCLRFTLYRFPAGLDQLIGALFDPIRVALANAVVPDFVVKLDRSEERRVG